MGVAFFDEANFQGEVHEYAEGSYPLTLPNDRFSSLKVSPDCIADVYVHGDYGGDHRRFYAGTEVENLENAGMDSRISSVKVRCDSGAKYLQPLLVPLEGVKIWDDRWFGNYKYDTGLSMTIPGGSHTVISEMNDKISSMVVSWGCTAEVFKHHQFGGLSKVYTEGMSVPDLTVDNFDNSITSMKVTCDKTNWCSRLLAEGHPLVSSEGCIEYCQDEAHSCSTLPVTGTPDNPENSGAWQAHTGLSSIGGWSTREVTIVVALALLIGYFLSFIRHACSPTNHRVHDIV